MSKHLITSALPYASGITHLGNVVGSTLPADIYARYCRLVGRETLYVCGSDEHGVAITIAADKEGITPLELINKYHAANKAALEKAGIAFDIYDRTSNPLHKETAQEFFRDWLSKGLLIEREEEQFYDEDAGMFLPDRYVEGVCPNCGYDKARGDQCDNCGAYYNQLDLKEPRSLVSGKRPVVRATKHWYFKLNEFQQWTEDYIERHVGTWKDNVLQQSRSWLKQGLAERAATRDMAWGIPVPVDGAAGKVIYVWFEAVLGYISATKQWALDHGTPDAWVEWWKGSDTTYTAFLGKDNIVFHTIIFPILLHSRDGYILPQNVPANEFLNLEGQKFSKSRNWAIDLQQYVTDFPEAQHIDVMRYVLAVNMPETKDSDFTWKDFQARANNELGSILGNYVNRVMLFTAKNFNATVPTVERAAGEHENVLHASVAASLAAMASNLDAFRFRDAVMDMMNIARAANKYFNDKAPWKAVKEDPADCALTIGTCLQVIRTLSVAVAPVLPNTAVAIQRMLNIPQCSGAPGDVVVGTNVWMDALTPTLPAGHVLGEAVILFTKIEDDVIEQEIAKLGGTDAAVPEPEPRISIDDFKKVQLRTGKILNAEPVPKSKKLMKLNVDLGNEQRQILAGIAEHYTAEQLVGMTIVVVANLAPAKLMGLESQGMVLAASNADGKLTLVTPSDVTIGAGAEVR